MENLKIYNENEQIMRDLYLRDIALGKIQGPITGKPSIDNLHLKYYPEEGIKQKFVPMSMYQLMEKVALDNPDSIALDYFGVKINNKQKLKMIDKTAKALKQTGVKEGDIVVMSLPNTPEVAYIMYAINKIGAVIHSINPLKSPELIKKDIIESKSTHLFVTDQLFPVINAIEKDLDLKKIITVSAFSSIPAPIRVLKHMEIKSKDIPYGDKYVDWLDFLKESKNYKDDIKPVYKKDTIATIVHTGGSTGIPKGVCCTNEEYNTLIYQHMYSDMGFKDGMSVLGIIPSFHALGLNNLFHLAACLNLKIDLIPKFSTEEIPDIILDKKSNIELIGPVQVDALLNSEKFKNADLSFIKMICSGGENLGEKKQKMTEELLKNGGSSVKVWMGYGSTETAAGTACMKNNCYKYGSVGIPYLKNVIGVFDPDNQEENIELGYNEVGEIRVKSPANMEGYFGSGAEETNLVIKNHDGERWYHTGDIGYIDQDGCVYITGRIKRIITRRENRIYPAYVEKIIDSHPAVNESSVVGIEDDIERHVPVANIVLNDGYDESCNDKIIEEINEKIKKEIGEYALPVGYNFISEIPHTMFGKVDFKALEKQGIIDKNTNKVKVRS